MKRRHVLPFDDAPALASYFYIAYGYSIVSTNIGADSRIWICGKYINCLLKPSKRGPMFIIPISDVLCCNEGMTLYQYLNFFKDVYKKLDIDIVSLLKSYVDSGIYINGMLNWSHISSKFESISDTVHNYLVTGYDDEAEVFIIKGFDWHSRIETHEIPYDDFINALFSSPQETISFHLLCYNPSAKVELKLVRLEQHLKEYLSSITTEEVMAQNCYYGMKAVQNLAEHLFTEAKEKQTVKELHLRSLLEHKWFMRERLRYLVSQGIVSELHLQSAEQVYKVMESAQSCGKRYNQTHADEDLEEMYRFILRTLELENEYLPHLVEALSEFNSTT